MQRKKDVSNPKPNKKKEELLRLNLVDSIVFKNGMNDITEFASNCAKSSKMMFDLGTLLLIESGKSGGRSEQQYSQIEKEPF